MKPCKLLRYRSFFGGCYCSTPVSLIFLGLPGRWRHPSSSDFLVLYKTTMPVLTFVKYVGCFQASVYQHPAHL